MDILLPRDNPLPDVVKVRWVNMPFLCTEDGDVIPAVLMPQSGDVVTDHDIVKEMENRGYHQTEEGSFELAQKTRHKVGCVPSLN